MAWQGKCHVKWTASQSSMLLCAGLIQKLKCRERERQRMQRQRSRESRRTLSYEAPPFYMPSEGTSSGNSAVGSADGGEGTSASSSDTVHVPAHRRQLGERLYPKVQTLQPVSILFTSFSNVKCLEQ